MLSKTYIMNLNSSQH